MPVSGSAGFRLDAEETVTIRAKSVILCTGADGFKPNGFPLGDLTHDGTVMAYRIGAKVTGKEWNDGHTTRSANPAATFDGWGDMFERVPSTNGIEVHHDLGADLNYSAYVNGNPVAGGHGSSQIRRTGALRRALPINDPRGLCGGRYAWQPYGQRDLYADRVSLAGSAVQGAIAGEAAAEYAGTVDTPVITDEQLRNITDAILAPMQPLSARLS